MAVYKPTYCYPYLTAVDIRVAKSVPNGDSNGFLEPEPQFLSCKIDTSNTRITGYKVRLIDENNKQIFPVDDELDYISPINELQEDNSGINGTLFKIPFFRNKNISQDPEALQKSYNAIYYNVDYAVSHFLVSGDFITELYDDAIPPLENLGNWDWVDFGTSNAHLQYNLPDTQIILDGDIILENEIIAALSNASDPTEFNKVGLYVAKYDSNSQIRLNPIASFPSNSATSVVITKGENFHNCVFTTEFNGTNWECLFGLLAGESLWEDWNGNGLESLQVNGQSLKWEITLYQGNPDPEEDSLLLPRSITYTCLKEEFLDITLNSGTILGSTPIRVQIASDDPYNNIYDSTIPYDFGAVVISISEDGTNYSWYKSLRPNNNHSILDDEYWDCLGNQGYNGDVVLPEATTGVILLQGKFVALGVTNSTTNGNILTDSRISVKSYDASYGHVYPSTDALETNTLQNASHCQFFKHSNNPKEILDTDIVTWGIAHNIPLKVSDSTIVIDDHSSTITESFVTGDFILLTDQDEPKQNGVYQYTLLTTPITIDGVDYSQSLKRAASYNSWAPYIGKIFYCEKGDYAYMNIQSLAPAGSYTLWDPSSTTSGDSTLLFTPELPILLFPQKIKTDHTYDLYCSNKGVSDIVNGKLDYDTNTIDDQIVTVGDLVLFNDGGAATLTGIEQSGNLYKFSFTNIIDISTLMENDFVYILKGQLCGQRVFKWGSNGIAPGAPYWGLHTATILKNRPKLTYVTPYINMKSGMMLKMRGNNQIIFVDSAGTGKIPGLPEIPKYAQESAINGVPSRWIPVQYYNPILNYIIHPEVSCLGNGISDPGIVSDSLSSYGLASYGNENNIPWKYDVQSFFTASNENIFYIIETPYIDLYRDGELYNGLIWQESQEFDVLPDVIPVDVLQSEGDSEYEPFYVIYYIDQRYVTSRSLALEAKYVKFNQMSWESFRWQLLDENGVVLQDTGDRYEGTIQTTFYGLTNTTEEEKIYYAVLSITDNINGTLYCVIKFTTIKNDEMQGADNGFVFNASLDSQTHSVALLMKDNTQAESEESFPYSSYRYSFYRREYDVYAKPRSSSPVEYREYIGEWTPVALKLSGTFNDTTERDNTIELRDYSVTAGHSYQYIVHIESTENSELDGQRQVFANYTGKIYSDGSVIEHGTIATSMYSGEPVRVCFNEWSVMELIPQDNPFDAPIVKKIYTTNLDQIWLFKFSLETGSQTQNISRSEFQTLGQYPKVGMGQTNYISGEVSALLGSEIVPYSANRYIERLGESRVVPLSTNERVKMLQQWRKLVYSKNPKLLKDMKGQAWIVQIFGSSNTPKNFYSKQPDTISFQWKQIGDLENTVVYNDNIHQMQHIQDIEEQQGAFPWVSIF